MILCHFFRREIKHKLYLMADSSASKRYEPLFQTPEIMFEITGSEKPEALAERAKEKILGEHRTLVFKELLFPKRRNATQVFDLVFDKKGPANVAGSEPRKRGIIERIIGK